MKVLFDWSDVLDENQEIDVLLTKHALERSRERYGLPVNIKKEEIEDLVRKSIDDIIQNLRSAKTFVIHGVKSKLNVVGALVRQGHDWLFKVITVMIKDFFKPKSNDKYLEVFEVKTEKETYKFLVEDVKETKTVKSYLEFLEEEQLDVSQYKNSKPYRKTRRTI